MKIWNYEELCRGTYLQLDTGELRNIEFQKCQISLFEELCIVKWLRTRLELSWIWHSIIPKGPILIRRRKRLSKMMDCLESLFFTENVVDTRSFIAMILRSHISDLLPTSCGYNFRTDSFCSHSLLYFTTFYYIVLNPVKKAKVIKILKDNLRNWKRRFVR